MAACRAIESILRCRRRWRVLISSGWIFSISWCNQQVRHAWCQEASWKLGDSWGGMVDHRSEWTASGDITSNLNSFVIVNRWSYLRESLGITPAIWWTMAWFFPWWTKIHCTNADYCNQSAPGLGIPKSSRYCSFLGCQLALVFCMLHVVQPISWPEVTLNWQYKLIYCFWSVI